VSPAPSETPKPALLYVTDLFYESTGRPYYEEDLFLSGELRDDFDVLLCQPMSAPRFLDSADGIVSRNTGPVMLYADEYERFREGARASGARVYNELTGKGDMQGKQHLVDLTREGSAVIPTVDDLADRSRLPPAETYVIKSKRGADSIGMRVVDADDLDRVVLDGEVLQPRIEFVHEASFFFVDHEFVYALYAPDPSARWELRPFEPSAADLAFARSFIEWNDIEHGIQRVDGCRLESGDLLLMELEDNNPYLSLDVLDVATRRRFVETLRSSLKEYMSS